MDHRCRECRQTVGQKRYHTHLANHRLRVVQGDWPNLWDVSWCLSSPPGCRLVTHTLTVRTQGLLIGLCSFDDGLDILFLLPSCFIVAPPVRSLVLAVKSKVTTCFAFGLSLITLLTS